MFSCITFCPSTSIWYLTPMGISNEVATVKEPPTLPKHILPVAYYHSSLRDFHNFHSNAAFIVCSASSLVAVCYAFPNSTSIVSVVAPSHSGTVPCWHCCYSTDEKLCSPEGMSEKATSEPSAASCCSSASLLLLLVVAFFSLNHWSNISFTTSDFHVPYALHPWLITSGITWYITFQTHIFPLTPVYSPQCWVCLLLCPRLTGWHWTRCWFYYINRFYLEEIILLKPFVQRRG